MIIGIGLWEGASACMRASGHDMHYKSCPFHAQQCPSSDTKSQDCPTISQHGEAFGESEDDVDNVLPLTPQEPGRRWEEFKSKRRLG